MKQKYIGIISLILFGLINLTFANTVKVNPHLHDVLNNLDYSNPDLAKVQEAKTDLDKQEALYDYFKNRKTSKLVNASRKNPPRLSDEFKKLANDALEHKFVGQKVYPAQFRGKDKIDWDTNPFADNEWIWQFHRFNWWDALGVAYLSTGNEKYAKEWTFELESWINHMHDPKNFENHPGWRPLETGGRLGLFAKMPEYFYDSESFNSYDLVNLLWTLNKHLDSINKRLSGMNNHRMHQWNGILIYTLQYPEFKNNTKIAKETLADIAKSQKELMHNDGVINEYIPSYHNGNVAQFMDFRRFASTYNMGQSFSDDYDQIIQNGVTAVMLWSHPDGTIPQFGDAWAGSIGACQNFVSKFLKDYNRPDWEYFVSNGKKGKKPAQNVHSLKDSGYSMMRSDWNPNAIFLVTKNSNPTYHFAHNHFDNQSFELSAYGTTLMMDSGCYSYFGSPEWRGFFRLSKAHQVITLDDKPIQSEGKFRWSKDTPELKVIATTNQAYPDLTHDRTFFMIDNQYIIIVDELSGAASGELKQHFQFMPSNFVVDKSTLVATTQNPDDVNLYVQTVKDGKKISVIEEQGWVSKVYMKKESRPAIAYMQDKSANEKVRFITFIIPLPKDRQICDNQVKVDGNTINFKLNNLEDYSLTFDHEQKNASVKKNFKTPKEDDKHNAFYANEREYIKNKQK